MHPLLEPHAALGLTATMGCHNATHPYSSVYSQHLALTLEQTPTFISVSPDFIVIYLESLIFTTK